jgi:hypothetical protein
LYSTTQMKHTQREILRVQKKILTSTFFLTDLFKINFMLRLKRQQHNWLLYMKIIYVKHGIISYQKSFNNDHVTISRGLFYNGIDFNYLKA